MAFDFTQLLMNWHTDNNRRQLPWKTEKDPYKIWLSEILLQQTQAETVIPYYLKFKKKYPSIAHLAKAKDDDVFNLWQGLGYYNRCRNMLVTARIIKEKYDSQFPNNYSEILALKGVGPYTAAAIASFAFNLPYAVVDGNVYRILSRIYGIDYTIDSSYGQKYFYKLAQELLFKENPSSYNQAIMDFGATICKPKLPNCSDCIFSKNCIAYKNDQISIYPIKKKELKVKIRYFHYLVFDDGKNLYLQKRSKKDVWEGLYEFYVIESLSEKLTKSPYTKYIQQLDFTYKQRLTHQLIYTYYYVIYLNSELQAPESLKKVSYKNLKNLAFTKSMLVFLNTNQYL
jgi:A/G-specific adenine glycosylase